MPVTPDEVAGGLLTPIRKALDDEGITVKKLAKQAKKELAAKQTKTVKLKGAVGDKLPSGYKNITSSGVIELDKDGEAFGSGETLIESTEINWSVRQKARQDMHKLRGDYPAEKHEFQFNEESLNGVLNGLPDELREGVIAELKKSVSGRRNK